MPGTFIDVEIADDVRGDPELAQKLEDACPVDIYAKRGGGVEVVEDNLDECVLCRLCLDASAGWDPNPVKVIKLYDDSAVLA